MPNHLPLLVILSLAQCGLPQSGGERDPLTDLPTVYSCVPIVGIAVCENIGYLNASFPNFRGQSDQVAIDAELKTFLPLIQSQCSNALVHLLCSVNAPFCDHRHVNTPLPPCKHLCDYVREGCEDELLQFNFKWPPSLECEQFPELSPGVVCFAPDNVTTVEIPVITGVTIGPTQATNPSSGDCLITTPAGSQSTPTPGSEPKPRV